MCPGADCIGELWLQLNILRTIQENERFLDRSYSDVVTPEVQEEVDHKKRQLAESVGDPCGYSTSKQVQPRYY